MTEEQAPKRRRRSKATTPESALAACIGELGALEDEQRERVLRAIASYFEPAQADGAGVE